MNHGALQQHEKNQAALCQQIRKEIPAYQEEQTATIIRVCEPDLTGGTGAVYCWRRMDPFYPIVYLREREYGNHPLVAYHRLLRQTKAIAAAKKRAREVILTLMLVGRRLEVRAPPREIWQRLLSEVNEEECDL